MKYLLGFLFVTLVGCNKNPYPDKGLVTVRPAAKPEEVRPAISADLPDNVEFKEGKETSITFRAIVPSPGRPVVSIENLPEGALFNPETLILSWRPDFTDGNVSSDPSIKVKIYPVVVWVRSSEDEVQAIRKSVNLVVYDQPRPINIISSDTFEVTEGEIGVFRFKVDNPDFSNGPFDISLGEFPTNVTLVKEQEAAFRIDIKPDYQHVIIGRDRFCYSYNGPCREYKSRLVASNPAGHRVEKEIIIKVIDKRIAPKAVAIDEMEQGLDVSFQVGGYDLNSETAPSVELTSKAPVLGRFVINTIKDPVNYSTFTRVSWTDLPPSMNGTVTSFTFKVCAYSAYLNYNNCVDKTVKVAVKIRERLAPVIDRSSWIVGEMKYLNFNQSAEVGVDIRDQENRSVIPMVEIFPESMRKYVIWNRHSLKMKFPEAGIFQFNVTATSQYGVKSIEGFVVEVFPESRGEVLLLSDSSRDKEVQFYRRHFKDLEVVNPFLQDLGTRLLSGRKTLIVGTSVLVDIESREKVQQAANVIRNIVIATPLIHNLPEKLYKQITDDFRVSIVGRYLDIPRMPTLGEMTFVTRLDFDAPKGPVMLSGSSSVESFNPVVFSTGVDTNNCDDVLEIADVLRLNRLKIGIICDRPGSGRLALLGTEWADLRITDSSDEKIPSKWLSTMLKAGLANSHEDQ